MHSVIDIVDAIEWKMTKSDLKGRFSDLTFIGDHPTLNAIGFSLEIHNTLTAMVCYFVQKVFAEKLAAVQLVVFQEPPPPEELDKVYSALFSELKARFGEPTKTIGKYHVWVRPGSVEVLTVDNGKIGLRHGHPELDLPSKMAS